jgi:phosphoribosyl-AMP cyclohydrolase
MLKFDDKGLIPVIVQDVADGTVLMLGYANKESLKLTLERGEMVFFSRSRQELWHKGETSGNVLKVKSIAKDCDSDTLLVKAEPAGPTCHTGERSCFFTAFSKDDLAGK